MMLVFDFALSGALKCEGLALHCASKFESDEHFEMMLTQLTTNGCLPTQHNVCAPASAQNIGVVSTLQILDMISEFLNQPEHHSLLVVSGDLTSTRSFPSTVSDIPTDLEALSRSWALTCITSLEQVQKSLLRHLQPSLHDGLLSLDLALRQPLCELLAGCRVLLGVVKDDEALHADSLRDDLGDLLDNCQRNASQMNRTVCLWQNHTYPWSLGICRVVLADSATHDETGILVCPRQRHVEDITAD